MNVEELLKALHIAGRLKDTPRHCYTPDGRRESVAEHSWRAALMVYLMKDAFPEADMNKVVQMLLIHDLGECFTGDIPTFDKTQADEEQEERLLNEWVEALPQPISGDMKALYREMNALETIEAKIYKCIDGMEAVISHNESDLATWLPNEYELNLRYGFDRAAFSPYLTELRQAVKRETQEKIAEQEP